MDVARATTFCFLVALVFTIDGKVIRNRLNGQHLTASTGHFSPSVIIRRNSTGHVVSFAGVAFEVFDWLSKRLHFSYSLYPQEDNLFGARINGTWNGMIGQMARKEVDLSLGPYGLNLQWFEAFESAGYVAGGSETLLVKYPRKEISSSSLFEVFDLTIWFIWLSSLMAVFFAALLLMNLRKKYLAQKMKAIKGIDGLMMYLIGTMTAQGSYYRMGNRVIGLLATVWCISSFVFVNVYSSTLMSYLSCYYQSPEINSLEELAASTTHEIAMIKSSISEINIMKTSTEVRKTLARKYARCASCSVLTNEEIGQLVMQGGYVGFMPTVWATGVVQKDFQENRQCRMTLSFREYGYIHTFLGVPRDSPYVEELNRETLWSTALGLNKKWRLEKFPPQCTLKYDNRGVAVQKLNLPLKLKQFGPAFIILFIGYSLSLVFFFLERRSRQHF